MVGWNIHLFYCILLVVYYNKDSERYGCRIGFLLDVLLTGTWEWNWSLVPGFGQLPLHSRHLHPQRPGRVLQLLLTIELTPSTHPRCLHPQRPGQVLQLLLTVELIPSTHSRCLHPQRPGWILQLLLIIELASLRTRDASILSDLGKFYNSFSPLNWLPLHTHDVSILSNLGEFYNSYSP